MTHYGYKKRYSAICFRSLELSDDGRVIAGLDKIETSKGLFFTIRFHISPKIQISLSRDNKSAILRVDGKGWDFRYDGEVTLKLLSSIYINDLGEEKNTNQVILEGKTKAKTMEVLWGFSQN